MSKDEKLVIEIPVALYITLCALSGAGLFIIGKMLLITWSLVCG